MKPSSGADRHRRRRVLIASYYFPPDAAVGGLRAAKFARTLPEFGWEPVVLTVRDDYREQGFDPERMQGLEHVSITRTGELPRVWRRIRAVLPRRFRSSRGTVRRGPVRDAVERGSEGPRPGADAWTARVKRWIISLVVLFPDDKKHWVVPAAVAALRLIRGRQIDYVLTSGPPFSTHLIGLAARACTRAKWIADFRDPWIDMLPVRFPSTRSRLSDFLERHMEALVARTADTVTVTTPYMQQAFRTRYPQFPASKFVCINNSIDTPKFEPRGVEERDQPHRPLTITYTGSLYFHRTPEPLFRAVGDLVRSGRIAERDIRIRLVGQCHAIDGVDTLSVARRYGLKECVEVSGPVPYVQALRMMRDGHLLLVLAPEHHRLVVPAKVYDYLGSGSKLLAIADPGATAALVDETGSGRCFAPADVTGLREYLAGLIADGSFRALRNEPESFSRYDLRCVTGRLVAELSDPATAPGTEAAVRE